ncbi:MAG: TIR domain-containing protein [Leptolyngbya sp. SIO3F4]|nr:TIR domain-containing protein [Leptolyngbya sp. SIO3F4]
MPENQSNYFVHTLLRARDWQHRPEFDQVCDWWRNGGTGICGLVGMGGAGKTAIVDRFLRVLPGVIRQNPNIPKDDTLPTPNSTFVFSFYDAPNAEAFFEALQMWLLQSPDVDAAVSYSKLLFRMQNAVPGLIVLDGLEKVQADGTRGIFGQLSTPNLRDFITRAANGYFSKLSVLITTRFPLADLQDDRPDFFQSIPIEEIDILTGIKLLRQRGVQGNDLELERIVKECGNHALTVDLAGGYIKEYGNGNPDTPLVLGTAEELEDAVRQEQDPAKRAVLKQGFRFARVARRYQEAMLEQDPAAIALLERICLFRLGVEADTLVAIFIGEDAAKVSGTALAGLNAQQLQYKLDWLVRMRIVEVTRIKIRQMGQIRTVYSIHPAVRDGFVQGIGRDAAAASHEAIRTGLEVSLGDAPGANPSESATLDILEEIVYHAIASGQVPEAWNIYWNKIGGYKNLLWRLGAYERGDRICRAFGGGQLPETVATLLQAPQPSQTLPCMALSESRQAIFINEWALYLKNLGRLDAAARCYESHNEMRMRQESWKNASIGNRNSSTVWLLAGRLWLGLATTKEALRLANQAKDAQGRQNSYSWQGAAQGQLGAVGAALEDCCQCLHWQHQVETHATDRPLYSNRGIEHTLLLTRLGRHGEAQQLTEANIEVMKRVWPGGEQWTPQCQLILADISLRSKGLSSSRNFYEKAQNWALARDSKETLCWAALVKARIELAEPGFRIQDSRISMEALQAAQDALTEGLKIARDCGYGIYHIDLLLEQSYLHLLQGNSQAALADIRLALNEGIPPNDKTGQPELLAANDPECGYAWGIVGGLHRRAEALLLQAAQLQVADSFIPARRAQLPVEVQDLIAQAETCLADAMTRWQDLRDPEVKESNFIHPETGEEYNYRAAETYQIIQDLAGGILTRYPLHPIVLDSDSSETKTQQTQSTQDSSPQIPTMTTTSPRVLISYSHDSESHAKRIRKLSDRLRTDGVDCWIDQYVPHQAPPEGWPLWMDKQVEAADFVLVVFTAGYSEKTKREKRSGSRFESVLILQDLYEDGLINKKFIPVLLDQNDSQYILKWFKPYQAYTVDNDAGYESLLRRLLDDPAVIMPTLGTPMKRGPVLP